MRVIIPCAGRQRRWLEEAPKQMVDIDGEPLLHRTVRQCREHGWTDIRLVVSNPKIEAPGTERVAPKHHRRRYGQADRFMNSRHLWNPSGPTLILYGDVYFSDECMDLIAEAPREWQAIARPYPSEVTGKDHGEMFGCLFWPEHHQEMRDALDHIIDLRAKGVITKTLGWQLARRMAGYPDDQLQSSHPNHRRRLLLVDDLTEDFDRPEEYKNWLLARRTPINA